MGRIIEYVYIIIYDICMHLIYRVLYTYYYAVEDNINSEDRGSCYLYCKPLKRAIITVHEFKNSIEQQAPTSTLYKTISYKKNHSMTYFILLLGYYGYCTFSLLVAT